MSAPNRPSIRIVVQHVYADHWPSYRFVAYGGGQTYRPVEFESLDRLQKALHSVLQDFDTSTLSIRENAPETYVALSAVMELDDSQLSILGLKGVAKS